MRHIHPFPARMAPDIALSKLERLSDEQLVLDPMCGSGMVLSQASKRGLKAFGYDLDPLAQLVSRVGATKINPVDAERVLADLMTCCSEWGSKAARAELPWIDNDPETSQFIDFWYGPTQSAQLRTIAYYLIVEPISNDESLIDLLKVVVSRLIVTKEPKASLARDTAHSRPHRTIVENEFDVLKELPKSLKHVLSALEPNSILNDATIYSGDARLMKRISTDSIDAIITSPPYLNAIDYMRGHRLSLVWWGFSLYELRNIRSTVIGAERGDKIKDDDEFVGVADELGLADLSSKTYRMLGRYYADLCSQTIESTRVLKSGGTALYVIGNSRLHGQFIENSELLKQAADNAGLNLISETTREIPNNRRYLPVSIDQNNTLYGRMRSEHILEFQKAS